ncbi:MerR family transcriptional regulator [Rhodohalobacter sp. 614A]|uniref:MerR family transcriptional regulator n=1 Tax=Rhodohalobacter sp. 614A TaxID=2908649 RepID=UPI001F239613|nr:MerR family transcriptional regulator [Rhodohalobacter sp. 614A]
MKKLYYSIGEVSEITSVEPHVLRYWETIFKDLSPRKNKAGNRTYREQDITLILKLKELVQNKKYSTAGAQKILEEQKSKDETSLESSKLPAETRKDLSEVRVFLEKLMEKL